MKLRRGEIWWADLGPPKGSEPSFRRPVLVVQEDAFNRSTLATVIVLALTSNHRHAELPGNVTLSAKESGLDRDSVVNVTQLATVDKAWIETRVTRINRSTQKQIDHGLAQILGLPFSL